MRSLFLLGFCFSFLFSFSQSDNFFTADSIALHAPANISGNIDSLASYLTANLETDIEKARSIFRWTANNISYDINKQITLFKNTNDFSQDATKVLKNKKAVCEGYSNLIYALCKRSGLTCEVVTGYAAEKDSKTEPQPHAWNAIKINNEWKLLDATWAAGGMDEEKNVFRKSFDKSYFCMRADSFAQTQYPMDPMLQ